MTLQQREQDVESIYTSWIFIMFACLRRCEIRLPLQFGKHHFLWFMVWFLHHYVEQLFMQQKHD